MRTTLPPRLQRLRATLVGWLLDYPAGGIVPLVVRVLGVVAACTVISEVTAASGGLPSFYSHLYYPLLLYAAIFLPIWTALVICAFVATGVHHEGVLMIDALGNNEEALVRPLIMLMVVLLASILAGVTRRALQRSERLTVSFLEALPIGVFVVDGKGSPYYANSAAKGLLGRGAVPAVDEGALAETYAAYRRGTDSTYPVDEMPVVRALAGDATRIDDMEIRRPDRTVPLEVTAAPIRFGPEGEILYAVAAFTDISERLLNEQLLRELALFDPLTQLANRRLLMDRIRQSLAKCRRSGLPLTIVSVDADNLKEVNDAYGHEAGDFLLQTIARRFSGALRETDTVARIGGDEFVIALPELGHKEATTVLQRLQRALQRRAHRKGIEIRPAASFGIAVYPEDGDDEKTLMRKADEAMYSAKRAKKLKQAGAIAAPYVDPTSAGDSLRPRPRPYQ